MLKYIIIYNLIINYKKEINNRLYKFKIIIIIYIFYSKTYLYYNNGLLIY
jgi:hypothetical protein